MRTPVALLLLFLAAPLAVAAPTARETGDLTIRARHILTTYCGTCHGEKNAAGRLNVFGHKAAVGHTQPAPFAGKGRALIVEFVKDGSMPLGDHPRPTAAEVAVLEAWVKADAPPYPRQFDDAATATAVLADWDTVLDKAARPYTRYVTLAHLLPPAKSDTLDAALMKLTKAEADLRAVVKSLVPVDAAATTFRFDLRDTGWHHTGLFKPKDDLNDVFPMIPFDLVWLENPHAPDPAALPAGAPDATAGMNPHHPKPNPFRPRLFLRGDWLAGQLGADGKPTPLAEELSALATFADEPDEAARKKLKGPKPRPFTVAKTDPPAPATSWYVRDAATPAGAPTLTVDVTGRDGKPVPPTIPSGSDIGLAVTLNRAGAVRLANVAPPDSPRGWTVSIDTPTAGGEPTANKKTVVAINDTGKFTLTAFGTQHYLVFAAGTAFKPVVVRTGHLTGNYPIFRAFPPDASVPTTRRVIPLTVADPK